MIMPDAYITRIGKFLRKISIDELLHLFNALKVDMVFADHIYEAT